MEIRVTGRLCLFGEHSDWAGAYAENNTDIEPGIAIVTGVEQGMVAYVQKSDCFRFRTVFENGEQGRWMEWPLSVEALRAAAEEGGYYAYVAGVAAYILENYSVGGISVEVLSVTLPVKKGLSSSAAICVLIARAFNMIYQMRLTVRGEMEAAYRGERYTHSRCGRLDQACAYGQKPVLMRFIGDSIRVEHLSVGKDLYWVYAELGGKKNTIAILSALSAGYPIAQNSLQRGVHRALGRENTRIVEIARRAICAGDAAHIGELMDESQRLFDALLMPACPSELTSPMLHALMEDPVARALSLGIKGVGSHGDGAVQMICESAEKQIALCAYLREAFGMDARRFVLRKTEGL